MLNRRAGVCGRYDCFCEEEDTQRLSLERQSGQKPAPQPPGECVAAPGAGGQLLVLGVLARLFRLIWREGLDL